MGSTAGRVGLGLVTGGLSEVVRPLTKNLFKTPKPPEAPPVIGPDTLAVQQKAGETSRRRSRARGYRSTILSQQFMSPDAPALKETIGA
jgi:hypothetical protein